MACSEYEVNSAEIENEGPQKKPREVINEICFANHRSLNRGRLPSAA